MILLHISGCFPSRVFQKYSWKGKFRGFLSIFLLCIFLTSIVITFSHQNFLGLPPQKIANAEISETKVSYNKLSSLQNGTKEFPTVYPPDINISTFIMTEEYGNIAYEYLHNTSTSSPLFHDENSVFSIIETNLASLDYKLHATAENDPFNTYWTRESLGFAGPNRFDGQVLVDTNLSIQDSTSTKFTVETDSTGNFYSDFRLLGWEGKQIPSIFDYETTLSGAFQFSASSNLLTNDLGFLNMIRFKFSNSDFSINIIFNQSALYTKSDNPSVYLDENNDYIIYISLGSRDQNNNILIWQENAWTRFNINITGILNNIYPQGSSLRYDAIKYFSNLSITALDIESLAFETGLIEFWLDDFQLNTTLPNSAQLEWNKNNSILVSNFGKKLENTTEFALDDFLFDANLIARRYLLKNDSFRISALTSFLPYIPVWTFKKQTFYHYNLSWSHYDSLTSNFNVDIFYSIFSTKNIESDQNTTHFKILRPKLLLNVLLENNSFFNETILPNFSFSVRLLRNFPFLFSNLFPQSYSNNFWEQKQSEFPNSSNNLFLFLEKDTEFQNIDLIHFNIDFWKLYDLDTIFNKPFPMLPISTITFSDTIFENFPSIAETISIPNLLLEHDVPLYQISTEGIQLLFKTRPFNSSIQYKFVSKIEGPRWSHITNHLLPEDGEGWIFIPWIDPPQLDDQIKIKILLVVENIGLGWFDYSTNYLLDSISSTVTSSNLITIPTKSSYYSVETNTSMLSINLDSPKNESNFDSGSDIIAVYSLLGLTPMIGAILYYRRRQRSRFYDLIFDE